MALLLSGLHAGPIAAHEGDPAHWSNVASHGHAHGSHDGGNEDGDSDRSVDLDADHGHHHCPVGPTPQLPQAELECNFGKQIVSASEASLLRLGAPAPPLDPPIA